MKHHQFPFISFVYRSIGPLLWSLKQTIPLAALVSMAPELLELLLELLFKSPLMELYRKGPTVEGTLLGRNIYSATPRQDRRKIKQRDPSLILQFCTKSN